MTVPIIESPVSTSPASSAGVPGDGCFFYNVRQLESVWEVTFGVTGSRFVYRSREQAEEVAQGAARQHWESRGEESGVLVEDGQGDIQVLARYGP